MSSIDLWLVDYLAARAGVPAAQIDRNERFKSLGLSSLEATTMLAELGRAIGRPLAPTLAWEYPTPAALARHLEANAGDDKVATGLDQRAVEPIAIVGLACRFPGAPDPDAFWQLLANRVDAICEVPRDRWDLAALYDPDPAHPGTMSTRWGGFLPAVDQFDPGFFGIAPREAIQIDPQQRLALELAWEALEDASVVPASLRDSRTGVFFGAMWMDYMRRLEARDGIAQHTATGQDLSIVSARVSYTLGAMGPSLTVNTACSSSLVAVHLACQSLLAGESKLAIAGGVNLLIAPESTIAMTKFGAMAPDGRCKTFDARANGYVRGEGGGAVVLERLSDARAAGHRVYCVIRGSAVNNDGFSNGLTAPSPKAQRAVLVDACARAGVRATDVQYVEAHGTGTMLGDPIEVGSLGSVYGAGRDAARPLRVGSVKTNIGHLEAAAGMAGIIKVALAMQHRELPASLHFETPNPHIAFDALRVAVQREHAPWRAEDGRLLAGVSSFGFGGTNSHAILEAIVDGDDGMAEPRLFALSAVDDAGLRERASEVAARLFAGAALGAICDEAARAPREAHRLAIVATSADELAAALHDFAAGAASPVVHAGVALARPHIAMLFTGQGSQYAGMGRRLYRAQPAFAAALDRAAAGFAARLERPLLDVMWSEAGDGALDRTAYTQPALFALEVAAAEMWRALGVVPDVAIGHSIGEIAAACVAGAIDVDGATRLVAARGRLMGELPAGGAMVAVATTEARALAAIAEAGATEIVAVASVNAAQSVVISGDEAAVLAIAERLAGDGVKTRRLTVSHAFHSPLMAPMRDAFRAAIADVVCRAPSGVELVTNLGGERVNGALDVEHWVRHVEAPVAFARGIAAVDADVLLEVGPHPVLVELAGAARREQRIAMFERGTDDRRTLLDAIARLFVIGAPVQVAAETPATPSVVVVSGRTAAAAREQARRLVEHCDRHADAVIADVAHALATVRSAFEHRIAVVAADRDELRAALGAAHPVEMAKRMQVAFVFSGQGSQVVAMGQGAYAQWPVFRDAFDRVIGLFAAEPALADLREVIADDAARLERTKYTQPALFAIEYALAALWRSWGVAPAYVAGHSIGEICAACVAGVFSVEDAVKLVAARARLMDALGGDGAMASVAASEADVRAAIVADPRVEVAAVNGPEQIVIAGPRDAVVAACAAFARTKLLPVSHAFHSAQMDAMLGAFAEVAATVSYQTPEIPVVSNVTGVVSADVATPAYWVRHVRQTVRFADGVRALAAAGATMFVEIGPRPVLLASIEATLGDGAAQLLASLRPNRDDSRALLESLGAYWARGGDVAWPGVFGAAPAPRVALPTYAFQRERYWLDRAWMTPPAAGRATGHALLGVRLDVAGHDATFETTVSAASPAWLADHVVDGRAIVPAAAIAELVRAAGAHATGGDVDVHGLVLQAPLAVGDDDVRVQVVIDDGAARVCARHGDEWQVHASATIAPAAPIAPWSTDLASVRARLTDREVDTAQLYADFERLGLAYGPAFRGLARLWRGDGEAVAELAVASAETGDFGISPMHLDAAIQAAIAARGVGSSRGDLALPFELAKLAVVAGRAPAWIHATIDGDTADLALFDRDGALAASARGLRLRRVPRDASTADGLYCLEWRAAPMSAPAASPARWTVIAHDSAWVDEVCAALGATRAAEPGDAIDIVCIWESLAGESMIAAGHRIAAEALAVVQTLARRGTPARLRWITRSAIGDATDSATDVAAATAWGVGRTAMHEHPELDCRLIDADTADAVARELAAGDDESQICWRAGQRTVARLVRAGAYPIAAALPDLTRGTVVITGGLGALGLHVAHYLAARGVAHLVLTGRRGADTPGAAAAVAVLSAQTRVTVAAVDVADRAALAALLAAIPADAPLAGIVHAAGVLDDGLLADQTPARFARVLAPKLDAAWHLHELTADQPLALFALFSSVSGLLGAAGQGNYAAANTALDALAAHRRRLGLAATSLQWGPWAESGMAARMTEQQQDRLARQGLAAWTSADGIARFAAAIDRSDAVLGVLRLDLAAAARAFGDDVPPVWRELVRAAPRRAATSAAASHATGAFADRLAALSPDRRIDEARAAIVAEVARVLSLRGDVPRKQPLSELGLDSLMAVELRNSLGRRVGVTLPATLAFDYPTVDDIAGFLVAKLAPAAQPARAVAAAATSTNDGDDAIAIIGMGCRYPGGIVDGDSYWRVLAGAVDAIADMPPRWDVDALYNADPDAAGKMTTRRGGFVADIEQFDAGFFGISPREAAMMDPQQRLLLETSWEALEHGGVVPEQLAGSDTGVFVGLMYQDYATLGAGLGALDGYGLTGSLGSVASGRLSYVLGLHGPSLTVDTACSSSLVTLHLASQALRRGECSLALAGGVALMLTPSVFVEFSRLRGLAPDGRCKSFGAGADGVGWAEGCGMLLLKRQRDAERDGDRILALVRGSAVNQDGRSNGLTAPNGPSQQAVIARALADAKVAAADVDYVECHGTGTRLGDPIEAQALGAAYGERATPLVIGSVKSNLGHTQAAAGAAGVMKVILALAHDQIPASLHSGEPSPHVAWSELLLAVASEPRPWLRNGHPRRAGVSSFGISGTNAHVIIEEPPARVAVPHADARAQLVPLSGKSDAAVRDQAARLASALAGDPAASLADVAHALATTRSAFEHRLAIVAGTRDDLHASLVAVARGETPPTAVASIAAAVPSKIVFVCPGQGSQWLGMGRALLADEPAFAAAFARCDRAILAETGWSPLAELAADEPSSQLHRIDVAQPMLFAFAVALAAQWRAWGIVPDAIVGHSMGEIAAAHIAGCLSLEDAAAVICRRSALMRRISGRGEMAVVELALAAAEAAIAAHPGLSIAVSNAPRSTVISGDPAELAAVLAALDARGVFCRRVKVDVASHSPQVDELRADLLAALGSLRPRTGQLALFSTVRGAVVDGAALDARYWVDNLREPVRFATAIDALLVTGHGSFVELSPHPILTTAVDENRRAANAPAIGVTVGSLRRGQPERAALLESLGALWTAGHAVAWRAVGAGAGRRVELPTYAWQHERHWLAAPPPARKAHAGHPLLGEPRDVSTQPGTRLWETTLDAERLPWLADHRVQGATVVPAAGYLEMALASAVDVVGERAFELSDVVFGDALAFDPRDAAAMPVLQTAVTDERGALRFQIASHGTGGWRVHARGRARAITPEIEVIVFDEARRRLSQSPALASDAVYAASAELGLDYGPAFRGIAEQWRGDGEALGRVRLPAGASAASAYRFHPALLDACLQVALAAIAGGDEPAPWVPVELDAIRVLRAPEQALWCHARLRDEGDGGLRADRRAVDLTITADDGSIVAELDRLVIQRLATAPRRAGDDDWYIELDAEPAPVPAPTIANGRFVLVGGGAFAAQLAAELAAHGHAVVHRDTHAYTGAEYTDAPTAIVHLGCLDLAPDTSGAGVESALVHGCDSVTAIVQTIAKQSWRDAPRLWLVTRGAQHAADIAVLHAPLLGLGRVIALEHAELRCARVDLDPAAAAVAMCAALVAELVADDGEDEILLRAAEPTRRVMRLVRRTPETERAELPTDQSVGNAMPPAEPAAGRSYRLALDQPGVLDRLHLELAPRRAPNAGEVEIAVDAAGVNFLDVLLALGVMPNDADASDPELRLGSECAGRVVAVGAGVVDLQIGDAVVAIAPRGAFASHVTLAATLVLPLPTGLSPAEAAALPVAYLTAWYALDRVAHLRRGDRVLIHAATGGVGLAAVQWAQHVGAEIYATAGSPEKRAYLASLGVQHVSDSRSDRFVADIRAWTGGEGVDVVLNSLSGDLLRASFDLLRSHGRFVEIGKRDYYADHQLGLRPFLRNLSFSLVDLRGMMIERAPWVRELFGELLQLVASGALRPPPIQTVAADRAADAFHAMSRGQHIGKLVLTFADDLPVRAAARAGSAAIRKDASYLVTGGLGGLGLGIAQWLAERGAGHLVLAGRSGVTNDAQRAAITAIETAGARVTVERADLANRADAARIVDAHKASLRGVIHAAGLLDDALVVRQTPAKLRAVMAPKLVAALHLDELTRDLPLDLFVLYSSSAGILGSPGQANYAAANTALDALAHARRSRGLPALAIDWGAFAEVGLAAAADNRAARLEARGMQSLAPADNARAVARLLASDRVQVAVVPLDARQWIEFYPAAAASRMLAPLVGGAARVAAAGDRGLRDQLAAASAAERVAILHGVIAAQVARVLRLAEAAVDPHAPLTTLGMDSLTGLELRNRIELALGVTVPATLLWMHPTVAALAKHFGEAMFAEGTGPIAIAQPAGAAAVPSPTPAPASPAGPPLDDDGLLSFIDGLLDQATRTEAP